MRSRSVTHLTSVHRRYDVRIFLKMCKSLVNANYQVNLIVADGLGNEKKDFVNIIDVGLPKKGRIDRMLNTSIKIYEEARKLKSDLYHFHDPELLNVGRKLKKHRTKVIFDSHEDVAKDILDKTYINKYSRYLISKIYSQFEAQVCSKLDSVVGATHCISKRFEVINKKTIEVNNYPILNELDSRQKNFGERRSIAYIGGISYHRGLVQLVNSLSCCPSVSLELAGYFPSDISLERQLRNLPGWGKVKYHSFVSRERISNILHSCFAGLVTFLPVANHIEAQPNKMFEYMSAGIPVIASNFPLWKEIIEGVNCGICVDPLKPKEIAEAINYLVANPEVAKQMGQRGRKAIEEKYNWSVEEQKLLKLYEGLLA